MPITLTDEYIAETYQGVIHSQGSQLSGTGLNGEVVMLYDGVGHETSIAIGKKGSGMSVYCNLSACGTLYLSGAEIRNIIDSRMHWSYDPNSDFIRQKTTTYDSQPIIGAAVQALSTQTLTAGGYTYPTTAVVSPLSSVMVLGANNTLQLVPFTRALLRVTKDRVIFCELNTTINVDTYMPITATTLNTYPGAYYQDRIAGDTLKVVGIRHYGNRGVFAVISYSQNVVVSANLRYEVEKYYFDGSSWVTYVNQLGAGEQIAGELYNTYVDQNVT